MITETCTDDELRLFIDNFLRKHYYRQYHCDYNMYSGELFVIGNKAREKYNPDKAGAAKFNTYLTRCLFNIMTLINKNEREWYEHHKSMALESFASPDLAPNLISQYRELVERISESELTSRTKEIVTSYLTKPYKSFTELGKDFGISKQRVSVLIESARQYLSRRGVEI